MCEYLHSLVFDTMINHQPTTIICPDQEIIIFSEELMKRQFDQQKLNAISKSMRKDIYFDYLLKCSNLQMQAENKTNYIYLQLKKCFHKSNEDFWSIWISRCIFKSYSKVYS